MISPKVYEQLLNNEGFLNDLWISLGATDKVSILEKSGFDLEKEYQDYQQELEFKYREN